MSSFTVGLHDMSAEAYQDLPALSGSGAWAIVQRSPLHYWHGSPMNPDYVPQHSREFDIGTAAHLAILEPDRFRESIRLVEVKKKDGSLADDYRTDAAKAARDEAYAAGLVPLFAYQVEQIMGLRKALLAHPVAAGAFTDGKPEQTFLWRDPDTNILCKARADWVRNGARYIANLKTSSSASPRSWPRVAHDLGYHVSAAWYTDGYELATGERPDEHWFVVIEREPPHAIAVYRCPERVIEIGRAIYRQALATMAQCIVKDECWGYRNAPFTKDSAFDLELPDWAEFRFQERYEAGEFSTEKPSRELLDRAMKAQAPL